MKRGILGLGTVIALSVASPSHAAWEFKVLEDPMTDAKRGIAMVLGDAGGFVVKCDSNGPGSLYLSVISKEYLGGTSRQGRRAIKYRIDKGSPQEMSANYDRSTASVFDISPGDAGGRFLTQVMGASELVVQVTSYDYSSYTIIFDVTGAREAVSKAAATCGDTEWLSPESKAKPSTPPSSDKTG